MTSGTGRKLLVALVVVLLIGTCVYFGAALWKAPIKVALVDGSTKTVVPGVHLLGHLGPGAAYVVETSDGLILIDAGLERDAQPVKDEMTKLGLDWKKVRAIFLTHTHGDHVGGADRLRAETGARIYAGEGDVPILLAGEPKIAFFSTFRMPDHTPHSTPVDVPLQHEETIEIGDARVQVFITPGHTTGSTCYLLERDGLRVLFSGDVIIRYGDDPLGTYTAYLAPSYRGDAQSYLDSLKKLKALPAPDLVLPGHPGSVPGLHSPRMTPQRWNQMLDRGITEMDRLVARYQADGANFLDGHAKQLLPDLYYFGDFQGSAVYGLIAKSRLFVINAPGKSGLRAFLEARLKELKLNATAVYAVLLTGCSEAETAGLQELLTLGNPPIYASPEGIDVVKPRCPPETVVLPVTDLIEQKLLPVRAIQLGGRGVAPLAYFLEWSQKSVLFSGRMPVVMKEDSQAELLSDLAQSKQNAAAYAQSLQRLLRVHPDLWLPAISIDAQNANLYDKAWPQILDKNYRAVSTVLQGP